MVRLTIGARLTLWYGAVWTLSLCALGAALYFTFARNLLAEIDRALDEELAEIEMEVAGANNASERLQQLEKYFGSHPFYAIQVAHRDGRVLFASARLTRSPLRVPVLNALEQPPVVENVRLAGGEPFRAASRLAPSFDGPLVIQAADSLELYRSELAQLAAVLLSLIPASVAAALGAGWWLSRRALAPVDALTGAARQISASRLEDRVSVVNPHDELGRLAAAFNAMIERLQQSFQDMQQFTADAAHELRTPLAVLRSEADVALRAPRSPAQYRAVLENQVEEIERMSRLVDQLLFLCREDAGGMAPETSVPVGPFISQLVDDLQPLAQERQLELSTAPLPACRVAIDTDRLRRLFYNLFDNAFKYTPPGGSVDVSGACRATAVEIVIADSGVGVPIEHVPHVFQRFYRADEHRGGTPGCGLGLAICRAIVEGSGGRITLSSQPGKGTSVSVRLPTVAES